MSTRSQIILLSDKLIREKGFNAFSFHDIAKVLGIKTASIHYYFPSKKDLGIEVVKFHQENLLHFLEQVEGKLPLEKIKTFFNVYSDYKSQDQICIVGSLSSDLLSIDKEIAEELKEFAEKVIEVVTAILQEGKDQNIFKLKEDARTHAIVLLSSLLASLQLTRLTNKEDFIKIQNTLIRDLTE